MPARLVGGILGSSLASLVLQGTCHPEVLGHLAVRSPATTVRFCDDALTPSMKTLTLFEHEQQPCDLCPRQIALLDQLQQRLPAQVLQPVYRAGSWHLRAGSSVGVLRLGQQAIQILPKISYSTAATVPAQLAREATANLLHMLAYAGMIQIQTRDVADLLRQESDWFELLTYLFASHLREEWQRGPVRSYQTVDDDLPLLKGKWRLNVQVQRPERAHRFAVTYDAFSVDIPLNQIFRFVVERLGRLSRSAINRQLLHALRELLDEVTLLPVVTVAESAHVPLNRLTSRYAPLLNLARLFLDQGALQIAHGETSLFAFVFDMQTVFEGFIAGMFRRHRDLALPADLQQATLVFQAQGQPVHLASREGRGLFQLKPDVIVRQGEATHLILDTKYKRLDPGSRKLGISAPDMYQMFAYARRYACPRVILLYPQGAALPVPIRQRFELEGTTDHHIFAATIDIRRDLGQRAARDALARELAEILSQR